MLNKSEAMRFLSLNFVNLFGTIFSLLSDRTTSPINIFKMSTWIKNLVYSKDYTKRDLYQRKKNQHLLKYRNKRYNRTNLLDAQKTF